MGLGIAWDPEWLGPGRLRVRGYRAANARTAIAPWEFDGLVATVDAALEDAGWTMFERQAIRLILGRLYERDLTGLDRLASLRPGTFQGTEFASLS